MFNALFVCRSDDKDGEEEAEDDDNDRCCGINTNLLWNIRCDEKNCYKK